MPLAWTIQLTTSLAFASIFSAVMVTMVAMGIQQPGDVVKATVDTNLFHGFTAVTNIVFAYG